MLLSDTNNTKWRKHKKVRFMFLKHSFGLLLSAALVLASQPVTVLLHDGSQVKGSFIGGGPDTIQVDVAGQSVTLPVKSIDAIKFEDSGATPAPGTLSGSARTAPAVPQPIVIPAGTTVVVRLIDPADSAHDSVNKLYRASVDQPISSPQGDVLVPRGADAQIILMEDKQSGRLAGKTQLTLALYSLTIDHQRFDIASSSVRESSSSRTGRSAKMIGGLASAGAIIGALAGGGKGAAIGAGSGAGLGTLGQVLTSGQRVKVPTETRLTFQLREPLQITVRTGTSGQ
jgi:hypothetical protein